MDGLTKEIIELIDGDNFSKAIDRLHDLEAQESMDNTLSVLLSAVHERLKLRISQNALPVEEIETSKAALKSRIIHALEAVQGSATLASEKRQPQNIHHVLLLIHGIRTHADWFQTVEEVFSVETSLEVVPIRYGHFDLAKFLLPAFRKAPIEKIRRELQHAREKYPHAKISVIAHSFGTYALMHAIRNDPNLELFRVVLCGSVIPEDWHFESYFITRGESTDIVNDCGVKDVWPVLARCCSWGYGASGTFGKAGVGIRDRKFPFSHSDFFNPRFISEYWVPFIRRGEIVRPNTIGVSMQSPAVIALLSSPLLSASIRAILWVGLPILLIGLAYIVALLSRGRFL
jgi:hypothetical protein